MKELQVLQMLWGNSFFGQSLNLRGREESPKKLECVWLKYEKDSAIVTAPMPRILDFISTDSKVRQCVVEKNSFYLFCYNANLLVLSKEYIIL